MRLLKNAHVELNNALRWALARPRSTSRYIIAHKTTALLLFIITVSAFVARFLATSRFPAPPGSDYGNYLTNLHALLGNDVTGDGVQYPWFFLVYVWGVVSLFGELGGLSISGPFLGAIVCVPSYFLLRTYAKPVYALVGSAIITFGEGISEMIGWGGNPNLLGLVFGTMFVAFLSRYLSRGDRTDFVWGCVSFGLLAGSHQISLAYFGVATLVALGILFAQTRDLVLLRRGGAMLGLGILASAPFFPFYIRFASTSSELIPSAVQPLSLEDVTFLVGWFFREQLVLWIPLTIAAVLGYGKMRRVEPVSFAIGVGLLVTPILLAISIMALQPVRPMYFLPLAIVPGAMAYLQRAGNEFRIGEYLRQSRVDPATVSTALILALAVILVSTANRRMTEAAQWYSVAGQDVLDALDWMKQNTPANAVIATSGPDRYGEEAVVGCTWGWWIEGYAQRKSFCTADLPALAWPTQVERSALANQAFAGVTSAENGWIRVGDYAPYGSRGNPVVSGQFGSGYEALVYFDDARVLVTWISSSGAERTDSPFFLANHSTTAALDQGGTHMTYVSVGTGLSISREVTLKRDSGEVGVNYSVTAAGTVESILISVVGTSSSRLDNFDDASGILTISGVPGFRERVAGSVWIREGLTSLSTAIFRTNPGSEFSEAVFDFSAGSSSFNVSFSVRALYDQTIAAGEAQLHFAMTVFATAQVRYVFVDKLKARDFEWFTSDRGHFNVAYQNFGVALFEVLP